MSQIPALVRVFAYLSLLTKTAKATNLEGLITFTLAGEVVTPPGTSAQAYITASQIPACPDRYQQRYTIDGGWNDERASYSIVQQQLIADFPVGDSGAVLDGEWTLRTETDEHNRKVQIYAYDYTGPYAGDYVTAQLATLSAAGGLTRSSITVTHHKTQHAVGEFSVLAANDGTTTLELVETVSSSQSGPLLVEHRYPGAAPLLLVGEQSCFAYTQSGRAIGTGGFVTAPSPIFDAGNYSAAPRIGHTQLNNIEYETTLEYAFLFTAAQAPVPPPNAKLKGPAK